MFIYCISSIFYTFVIIMKKEIFHVWWNTVCCCVLDSRIPSWYVRIPPFLSLSLCNRPVSRTAASHLTAQTTRSHICCCRTTQLNTSQIWHWKAHRPCWGSVGAGIVRISWEFVFAHKDHQDVSSVSTYPSCGNHPSSNWMKFPPSFWMLAFKKQFDWETVTKLRKGLLP